MKQTNNAIKFLLAQYRAIFKQAYLKGLASAVILTTGLAAGATANAALDLSALSNTEKETITVAATDGDYDDVDIKVNGEQSIDKAITVNITGFTSSSPFKTITASGNAGILNAENVNWNIQSDGAGLAISDAATSLTLTVNTGKITVNSTGSSAATLSVTAANAGTTVNLAGLSIGDAGSGEVTVSGDTSKVAILSADTILLGDDGKVSLAGASDANTAIFEGQLNSGSTGIIEVGSSAFGTVKTWTADNESANVQLKLSGDATIDLYDADNQAARTLKLGADGEFYLGTVILNSGSTLDISEVDAVDGKTSSSLTVQSGANFITSVTALDAMLDDSTTSGSVALSGTLTLAADSNLGDFEKGKVTGAGTIEATTLSVSKDVGGDLTGVKLNVQYLSLSAGDLKGAVTTVTNSLALEDDVTLATGITLSGSTTEVKHITGEGYTLTVKSGTLVDIQGQWDTTADITVTSGSSNTTTMTLGEGDSLTFKNAALTLKGDSSRGATVQVNSGSLSFEGESALNLDYGTLEVTNATVDLSDATISGSQANNIIKADASGKVIVDTLAANVSFSGVNGGVIQANTVETAATGLGSLVTLDSTSTLAANTLTFSDTGATNLTSFTGILQVNEKLAANGAITIGNGVTLNLGDADALTTKGSITQDLSLANATTVVGTWTQTAGKGLTIAAGGDFKVGNGTVAGNYTTDKLTDKAAAGKITVNAGSTLTVNGITGAKDGTDNVIGAGSGGYAGFDLDGTTVSVNGGTFVIGQAAAGQLMNDEWVSGSTESGKDFLVYANFGEYALSNDGVLKVDFASGESLSIEQFKQLKVELVDADEETGKIDGGSFNIGAAEIAGVTDVIIQTDTSTETSGEKFINYNDYQLYSDVLTSTQLDSVKQAQLRGVDTSSESLDSAHVGSIELAENQTSVDLIGSSSLNNADSDGVLISNSKGEAADANLQAGASLNLNDDGAVSDITLVAGTKDKVTALNINKQNTFDSIMADSDSDGSPDAFTQATIAQGASATVKNDVIVASLTNSGSLKSTSGSVITANFTDAVGATTEAKIVEIQDQSTVKGTVTVSDTFSLTSTTVKDNKLVNSQIAGTVDASKGTAELSNTDIVSGGAVTANKTVLDQNFSIEEGGVLTSNSTVIGDDQKGTATAVNTDVSISGLADLGTVTFASGSTSTSNKLKILDGVVTAKDVTGATGAAILVGSDTNDASGVMEITGTLTLNGSYLAVDPSYDKATALVAVKVLSGQNKDKTDVGIFDGNVLVGQNSALGVGVDLNTLKGVITQYQQDGHFLDPSEDGNEEAYGAVLYLNKPVSIDSAYGITLTSDTLANLKTHLATATGVMGGFDPSNDYAISNVIYLGSNTALAINTDNAQDGAYIQFVDSGEKATNSTVVADGGEIVLYGSTYKKTYQIFDDENYVSIKDLNDKDGTIYVVSQNGFLEGELTTGGSVSLNINDDNRGVFMAGASTPVQQTIEAYLKGYNGDAASLADAAEEDKLFAYVKDKATGEMVKDTNAYNNTFLSQVVLGGNGADVEKVARLGVYGGVAQAALTAGSSTYEAVSGRMGMGAQTGSVTFADNGQGAGLWVSPIYKNHDSDGFGAQGVSYGADLDLYGVALGADYTLANGLRLGAAFNVGSGDADGQGAGAGVSNDFDYYGFSIYGGYTMGALSVVGDISYTVVDNDVEANTGVEKVAASMDSSNLSVGVTGQYVFDVNGVNVTPHAGMRYTYLDMDDYTVKGSADIAHYNADSASVFSIPVGVTFSKDIVSGDWTIKPALDVTLTANMGDDSVDGSVTWTDVENLQTNLESEVIDSFTYGATLGVSAKSGNLSFGFGVNYTGASNADEFGVNANARFVF